MDALLAQYSSACQVISNAACHTLGLCVRDIRDSGWLIER